ncbi:oxidoreductase [Streptomyces longispororuber]|uniref:Oxidoreductase n=1 Tax=Streptomyces longispororuber TaxID=68230 RepID=A0A918ZTN6_9ACTN|nr:Gfo/Idh/MocA family oxidoreductase [Streptomyces longispororuber]GHE70249.1 oxidoreductase [Streptomyces longispororuber]
MQTERIRVGVIGCGTVAQIMHLPYLRDLSDHFEIAALGDLSPGLLDHVGERYAVPASRRFTDHRALLDTDVDAVLVLSGGSHAPQVLAAAEAGKHVFVEKPLCFTLREADLIDKAVARAGVCLMVGYMKRFDPGFRWGQRLVGAVDDARFIQIDTLHPSEDQYIDIHGVRRFDDVPREVARREHRVAEELLDEAVGAVSDALRFVYHDVFLGSMVHDINALRALVGAPEDVLFTDIWPPDSRFPSVNTVLRHSGELRTSYTWTYLDHVRDYFEEIAVFSPTQRVRIQFPSPFLKHWPTPVVAQSMEDGAHVEKRVQVSYDEAFREELRAFHSCVTEGAPVLTDVQDARADIALLQQVFARSGVRGLGGEAARYR